MKDCKKVIDEVFNDVEYTAFDSRLSETVFLRRFGRLLAKRRRLLQMSQEEFASRAGLHRSYVSDIERGARNIGTTNLIHIAHALGLPAWVLIAKAELNNGR